MPRARTVLKLTQTQERALLSEIKGGDGRAVRRAQVLRLLAQGTGAMEIGRLLGISKSGIHKIRKAFERDGLSALHDKPRGGRPPKAGPVYIACLKEAVRKSPRDFKYAFSNWTLTRLREHLGRRCGILISPAQLSRVLHNNGIVYRRPRHVMAHLRDQAEYDEKKELLSFLKKKWQPRARLTCSSLMSVRFTSTRP
jgi:transposase